MHSVGFADDLRCPTGASRGGKRRMITFDWGDSHPSQELQADLRLRMAPLVELHRERVALRRRGSGYEAQVRTALPGRSTVLRLHGEDLADVVDRATELLLIVARESAKQRSLSATG